MKFCNLFVAAMFVAMATVSVADAQLVLVPNGNFATPGGTNWVSAGPAAISYETTGGAGGAADGFGRIDTTAAGWGVLVAEGAPAASGGIELASLGMMAGQTYTFQVDLKNLGGGTQVAGMKIENWSNTGVINDSGDIKFATNGNWATKSFSYLVAPTATRIKFVPLNVDAGSNIGFDNVGVVVAVPEPGSLALIGLGMVGLVARRRRS